MTAAISSVGDVLQRRLPPCHGALEIGAGAVEALGGDGRVELGRQRDEAQHDDKDRQKDSGEETSDDDPASRGQPPLRCFGRGR